jgi:N,N'-diacetyllegionaminate synthase
MTIIIAEIGWNHMGDISLAKKMIQAAKESGADYAKFQTWHVKNLKKGSWDNDGRRQIYEKAELTDEKHFELKKECDKLGIKFLTSVFCSKDVEFVSNLIDEVKIPSTEMDNEELIDNVIKYFSKKEKHHIFLSTGTSLFKDVKSVVKKLKDNKMNFSIMHCVSSYPCPYNICNLDRINELKKIHDSVGYSGHCQGVFDSIVSLEYDIDVIEKHFTIDHNLPGRDNKFAILPHELKYLCDLRDNRASLKKFHQNDFLENEKDCRNNYKRRWGK